VAVLIAFHAACLVAVALPWPEMQGDLDFAWWRRFAMGSGILLVVGLVDDVRGMRPGYKLVGQALAAFALWWGGLRFGALLELSLPVWLDGIMVVLWIVGIINAFNLIDGMDGLASGLACISAAGLCGILIIGGMPAKVLVLVGLIGGCVGFLRYNFHPASIFLGDTGSMFLGFTLAVVSLETLNKGTLFLSLGIPLLVLGVPIHDELLAVWRRGMRRLLEVGSTGTGKRTGVMSADLDHIHHRLLRAGLSTKRVAFTLYLSNVVLVAIGLLLTLYRSYAAGILLLAFVAGVFVLIRNLAVIELRDTGDLLLRGLARPTPATIKALWDPLWDMAWMGAGVALAMRLGGEPRVGFWKSWFLELPIWITPTVSLLAWSRCYLTVWTRARVLDALLLTEMLIVGLGVSMAIALLIDPASWQQTLFRSLIVGAVSHPPMLGRRVLFRAVQEMTVYLRNKAEFRSSKERVVLYGAGRRCQLLLKERALRSAGESIGQSIVGLLDDDPVLHGQWVYAYPVLGGCDELARLIALHRLTGVVLTTDLGPDRLRTVRALSRELGFRLSEWHCGEKELEGIPPS
jgi:UDP-N-acetylmuramyl pentapeptide phosphotransferase/UDP-N-acetylglucosamine-1-phosphate transferase